MCVCVNFPPEPVHCLPAPLGASPGQPLSPDLCEITHTRYILKTIAKHAQDLHTEDRATLMKEITDLNNWRHIVFVDWKTQHGKYAVSPN